MSAIKDSLQDVFKSLKSKANEYPSEVLAVSAFAIGAVTTFGGRRIYTRYFRRIQNGDWITPGMLQHKRWIKGVVTRLKRVDAPEAAHFGRPAQPFSEEALVWLKDRILGKTLYCQILRRDQYSRVVAMVIIPPMLLPGSIFSGKNLSLEMLKSGWGTTYQQAGAEYGKWGLEEYLRVEAEAKIARKGMWKGGVDGESPAEYKKRHASLEAEGKDKGALTAAKAKTPRSLFSRLFSK